MIDDGDKYEPTTWLALRCTCGWQHDLDGSTTTCILPADTISELAADHLAHPDKTASESQAEFNTELNGDPSHQPGDTHQAKAARAFRRAQWVRAGIELQAHQAESAIQAAKASAAIHADRTKYFESLAAQVTHTEPAYTEGDTEVHIIPSATTVDATTCRWNNGTHHFSHEVTEGNIAARDCLMCGTTELRITRP